MSDERIYDSYTVRILRAKEQLAVASNQFFDTLKAAEEKGSVDQERRELRKLHRTALRCAKKYLQLGTEARDKGQIASSADVQDVIGSADFSVRLIERVARTRGL